MESTTLRTKQEEPGVRTRQVLYGATSTSGSTSTGMTAARANHGGAGGLDPAEGDGSGGPLGGFRRS